jgi:unsaturated chondroitin disaccharide hydrolase
MKDNKTHDMGFIFGPSCVMGNRIQPDPQLVEMALAGAHNMEDLFEEKTGLVLAWDEPGYEGVAIVDTIMNAPIMVWAAEQEGNETLYNKAITLADHIRTNHIRSDHSIFHVVRWDTKTFEIIERTTHQGFSADSCWSRGQAWALYGFANMYRYTSKKEYLETSAHLSEYFWRNLDDDLSLPRWDFIFKNNKEEPLDAAAASIAASGMLLLSKMFLQNKENEQAGLWKQRAERLIEALADHCFFKSIEQYGLIEHVTVDKPRNSGVNESSMYGDYYFMEALYRLMNYDDDKKLSILY